jgi:hypothetical protein
MTVTTPSFKRYLAIYGSIALLLFVAAGVWSADTAGERQGFNRLYRYQLDKLANTQGPIDTVLLGDSSLGNAVDAKLFGELAHGSAINLALTGAYGYAGSYNMLQRVLKRFKPRNVVIVNTVDMMQRESDDLGNLMSADIAGNGLPDWSTLVSFAAALPEYLQLLYNRDSFSRGLQRARAPAPVKLDPDYFPQRPPIVVNQALIAKETLTPGINLDKTRFLAKLLELCNAAGIHCVYAHGPLLAPLCVASIDYIRQATRAIRSTGIQLVTGTPMCVPAFAMGDTIDHVAPAFKSQATREYYRLLAPALQ